MPRNIETRPLLDSNVTQEQQPKGGKLRRGAKAYRNFNLATGTIWAGIGIAASGGLAAAAFGMAAFDGAQAAVSHGVAKRQERKESITKQQLMEAKNGKYMKAETKKGNSKEVVVFDAKQKDFVLAA